MAGSSHTYLQQFSEIEKMYWRDVRRHAPLSRSEEEALVQRIRAGEEGALEQLVEANLRFVVKIAKDYSGKGLSLLELVSEGNLGLIEAARRFDEGYGCKFITYAVWWIRQHILKALGRQRHTVPHPANHLNDLKKIERQGDRLSQTLGRVPTLTEAATAAEISPARGQRALQARRRDMRLDRPLFEDEEKTALPQALVDRNLPDRQLEETTLAGQVERGLETLNTRERQVLRWYFGLGGCQPITLESIGDSLGLTRERIRQIRDRALQKLRGSCNQAWSDFSEN